MSKKSYIAKAKIPPLLVVVVLSIVSTPGSAHKVTQQFDVRIPMRDGAELSADMWLPAEEGRFPVILIRTPYIKTAPRHKFPEYGHYFAGKGYVFMVQDVRGRGDSEGEFGFFFQEADDGYDTIEWIARQSWSDGKVGMMGGSYWGTVQWLAAREKAPHLVCIVPTAPGGDYFNEVPYVGGAFMLGWALSWINDTSGRISQGPNASKIDWKKLAGHRPLLTVDEEMGRRMPLFREFLDHPTLDAYWERVYFDKRDFQKIDLPAFTVTGWFDGDQPGALFYWNGMARHSPAKDKQYLLIGPWTHSQTYLGGALRVGEMEFSGDSVVDNRALHLAFYDRYLKGSSVDLDFPRAKVYVTGINKWRQFSEYPPDEIEYKSLYFHSDGKANTLSGDGYLSWKKPGEETPDRYTYNPKNPAPENIEGAGHAADQRAIERRDDVLVYTSEVLEKPLEIIGPVELTLYAASDALDTDFTAKILDVFPDGRAVRLGPKPGVIRARYRNGYTKTELLTPGRPEKFTIDLYDIGHAFLQGHKIRIEISSSAFPFINPNQNTGNPVATDTEWKTARQTVYHDTHRPSHVLLPVMPMPEPGHPPRIPDGRLQKNAGLGRRQKSQGALSQSLRLHEGMHMFLLSGRIRRDRT